MTSFRLLLVSTAPCVLWAFATGCGSGGGFRGATLTEDDGGTQGVTSGMGGTTNPGGMNAGGAGAGDASGGDAGAGGLTTDAGAGAGGETVDAGEAGAGGASAGALGTGGAAGDASSGAKGGSIAGGGAGGAAGNGAASGIGGSAASGGSVGAAGEVVGGGGGMSGAGSGGSAGSGGPLRTCGERCGVDVDCRIFGVDQGYRCNASTQRCERFAEPCRSSLECLPEASFWIFDCATDADCFFFGDDLCVDVGGVGRCARLAPSANGCDDPNGDEVMLPRFGAEGGALVCANASLTCLEGACVPGCRSNADCSPSRNGSVCDLDMRVCRCVSDDDCGGIGVSHCNTRTGRCECADSGDCDEVPNTNTCTAGRCGCAAVGACNAERTFSGTSYVCE